MTNGPSLLDADQPGGASSWPAQLRSACRGIGLHMVFQPIIDVAAARTAGYEALLRFGRHGRPQPWLAAARRYGCIAELEATALRSALRMRGELPPNCFLSVNVSPDLLPSPAVRAVWREQPDLGGVVVELTEKAPIDSYRALEPDLDALRSSGALLAVDDAGAGYAGLQHLIALRPAVVKLDASLVHGVAQDEAKRALIDMIGTFAGRIDAWLLAEGVEHASELEALSTLGVPLVQGHFLGRPAAPWADLSAAARDVLRRAAERRPGATVRSVLETAPVAASVAEARARLAGDTVPVVVLVDRWERPLAALEPLADDPGVLDHGLRVNLDTPLDHAAQRAMTRPAPSQFQPLLCTDNAGRFVGIVRMERLMLALAASVTQATGAR